MHIRFALSKVTLQVAKDTSRKTRSYMQAYTNTYGGSHVIIEKFVKICKWRQTMFDQETAYLERIMTMIEWHRSKVKKEQLSLAQEDKGGLIELPNLHIFVCQLLSSKRYWTLLGENVHFLLNSYFKFFPWYNVCIIRE